MLNRSSLVTSLVGILLASLATGALAEPTNLTCTGGATGAMGSQVVFDESAKTASFGSDPVSAATFSNTDIVWQVEYMQAGTEINASYQLSRSTLAMTRDIIEKGQTNGQFHFVYNCAVATKNKF